MRMHLFVLPSGRGNASRDKTIASFSNDCISTVSVVSGFKAVNSINKTAQWYGVFLDNEYIDKSVKKSLKTFLMTIGNNALILYKKNYAMQTADWYPRIFRSSIRLYAAPFKTEQKLECEKILNGWVCEHGFK